MASAQEITDINDVHEEIVANVEPTHEFSSPWEDSDLILIVEKQHLHVHSFALKMASPVFKAMLSGDFKEKHQREIPLPEKKADQFVDFLRQVYVQFDYPINMENVEHIFTLADEYQIPAIKTSCLQALGNVNVTKKNLPTVIDLAQKISCEKARESCYKILNKMTVEEMMSFEGFMTLDKESLHQTIVQRAKRLEECLKRIQPQFVGVLDCLLYVWKHLDTRDCSIKSRPELCNAHHERYEYKVSASITTRLQCASCVQTLKAIPDSTRLVRGRDFIGGSRISNYCYSSCGMYVDENLANVLYEMVELLKTK